MKKSYVTFLSSDDFLPGVLVVYQSLKDVAAAHDLLVMVTGEVSGQVQACLRDLSIRTKNVASIVNPYKHELIPRFASMFSKLQFWGLTEFSKVVYIDADMLVCGNMDELFDKPSWSAVNAGGMLPEHQDWVDLNAGLMVAEPNMDTFDALMKYKGLLKSKDGSDQGFLHSYFPEWPANQQLHLDHGYNMYVGHLDDYANLFGYEFPDGSKKETAKTIRNVHFWGDYKPWCYGRVDDSDALYNVALSMWWECYERIMRVGLVKCTDPQRRRLFEAVLDNKACSLFAGEE